MLLGGLICTWLKPFLTIPIFFAWLSITVAVSNSGSPKGLLPYSDAFRLIECNTWQTLLICVGCRPVKTIKTADVAAALLKQDLFAQ